MGMFDYYEPRPAIACPRCGEVLSEWQGGDGPSALFVWQQGTRHPVDQRAGDSNLLPHDWNKLELPRQFVIHAQCCHKLFGVDAVCAAPEGVWNETRLVGLRDVDSLYYYESKEKR